MALSQDGNFLYIAETFGRTISTIPISYNGEAGEKETITRIEGFPDGLALAVKGRVYVSCYEPSRLYRFETNGGVELLIDDPDAHTLCHPTNAAFRGDELFTANLGRWHITRFKEGVEGALSVVK